MSEIAHLMKSTVAPLLLPVLRSRGQAEMAELVNSRRVGRSRLVSGGTSPLQHHLGQLLMMSFGPRQVIATEFGSF
ncbi:MAG: hypothetical protein D4R44_01930 [Actinobacteria bacterium]|nr:MAG: hypothetical protein D4R44_01930 [Actinomycetota bacterium]